MAKVVLAAKKHLLLEKPMALSAVEARELAELAQRQGVIGVMNFEFRCIPAWQYLAELLAAEYVGHKRLIKVDWLVSSRADASRPWNWYARKDQGGGALGAIGSHAFDYITWLFGPVRSLSARLVTSIPARPNPVAGGLKPVDADDTCLIALELMDGTPCQINLSSVTYQGRGHWVEVYGDRGTLILGSDNQKDYVHGFRLWGSQTGQPLTELEVPKCLAFPEVFADGRIAPLVRVIDRLVEGIDRNQQVEPSLQAGVYSQQLMDLAHQSHQTNRWLDVVTTV